MSDVKIPVPVHVVSMLCVVYAVIHQFVHAWRVILEIHSLDAQLYKVRK